MIKTLADALQDRGFTTLTAVQEAVIEPKLNGLDLLVSAQTGSGKTLGFGLAIAPTILQDREQFEPAHIPLALIIAPTRELAMQVKRELSWLYAKAGAVVASCVGGMDMRDERRSLERGSHIVVATPGRLRDHIMRGSINLSAIRAVVLDEADEMLDLGFREDLEFILGQAPAERQTLMFSATVPKSIASLAKNYQKDAVRISTAAENKAHVDISYKAMQVAARDGENAIVNVLRYYEAPNAIVFCNTRSMVNRMTTRLSNRGFSVVALSGELSQTERSHALQSMRDGRARICVATDVAARGIDLPNLDLVIHADLPNNHETMLHRSGRTGRGGRKGVSALIVPPSSRKKAERFLNMAKITPEWRNAPSADEIKERDGTRMMASDDWQVKVTDSEQETVSKLVEQFTPDQIAAAYLRMYQSQYSAPEDLIPVNAADNKPREKFGPSIWFSIVGGRDVNIDPRRLLPMICTAGDVTKDDIGAIRIQQDLSYFEIKDSKTSDFLTALGKKMEIEGAKVIQLASPPKIIKLPRADHDTRKKTRKPNTANPIDWNDDPVPRKRKPKPDGKKPAGKTKPDKASKPSKHEGAVDSYNPDRAKPKAGKKPHRKGNGTAPPVGKPNSKKNKLRAKAKKLAQGKS